MICKSYSSDSLEEGHYLHSVGNQPQGRLIWKAAYDYIHGMFRANCGNDSSNEDAA
jgi:hypothetical protein